MTNADLDYITEVYGDGDCGIFAQALCHLTGLNVVLFRLRGAHALHLPDRWPRHAAVSLGGGVFLDAYGISRVHEIEDRFDCRLTVDVAPQPLAYPFQSAPGGLYFEAESWEEALALAGEMLEIRGLQGLADNSGLWCEVLQKTDKEVGSGPRL